MFIWITLVFIIAKVQVRFPLHHESVLPQSFYLQSITPEGIESVVGQEYYYGLTQFQENVDFTESNLTHSEVEFINNNINLMVLYGESLIEKSKELFEDYAFIVDAKRVYAFVSRVRRQIKIGINQLMDKYSSNQINRKLSKIYSVYSQNLKSIVDKEIEKLEHAINQDEQVIECWDIYKVLMLELGFDAINDLKILSYDEGENLVVVFNKLRDGVSSNINQLIADLSKKHSPLFSARSKVNNYVSSINFSSLNDRKSEQSEKISKLIFRSKTMRKRFSIKSIFGSNKLALHFNKRRKMYKPEPRISLERPKHDLRT
jgi:hypothetical protein